MGKLIVIDGVDSSGKQTQTERLVNRLGGGVKKLSFPNYEKEYCAPVKLYLSGAFGDRPDDVNPYAASTFYAVDRYCSFKEGWQKDYEGGKLLIADRYTTSNAIHQGSKFPEGEREAYFRWLYELEFDKMGLPRPDLVLFLDMPPEVSRKLMEQRANKITGGREKDIHEKNREYLDRCYDTATQAAAFYGWETVRCVDEQGRIKTPDAIEQEIYERARFYANI